MHTFYARIYILFMAVRFAKLLLHICSAPPSLPIYIHKYSLRFSGGAGGGFCLHPPAAVYHFLLLYFIGLYLIPIRTRSVPPLSLRAILWLGTAQVWCASWSLIIYIGNRGKSDEPFGKKLVKHILWRNWCGTLSEIGILSILALSSPGDSKLPTRTTATKWEQSDGYNIMVPQIRLRIEDVFMKIDWEIIIIFGNS